MVDSLSSRTKHFPADLVRRSPQVHVLHAARRGDGHRPVQRLQDLTLSAFACVSASAVPHAKAVSSKPLINGLLDTIINGAREIDWHHWS